MTVMYLIHEGASVLKEYNSSTSFLKKKAKSSSRLERKVISRKEISIA